ncbi:MAG: hypothetical protein JSU85_04280 [Candidatus Zixiibacteriota bacterium]|nr:MAG: hypothetical protein JSU85_04280 [candidate division Zixibacteria bacterium]
MKRSILFFICSVIVVFVLTTAAETYADVDDLLRQYETGDKDFEKFEIGDLTVYWHQRTIDGAIVEKDQIVYQFDGDSKQLLDKKMHWREDLPQDITVNIDAEEAESKIEGEPISSTLYIISPESDVYKVDPIPDNPCWIVRILRDDEMRIVIVDAVTGDSLGYGVPPPYESFSLTGPWYPDPCSGGWLDWYESAEYWFNLMGYSCEAILRPEKGIIQGHVQSTSTGMFYELAHGGSNVFVSGCIDGTNYELTRASDIESWIAYYPEMRFAFMGSCLGMCETGDNTFSYEFRKGSMTNTVTVGYCEMAEDYCALCWDYSIDWQDSLFSYMYLGWTVKDAFDQAQADYPACAGSSNCMRFVGDENFSGPYYRSSDFCHYVAGDVNGSDSYNGLDITYGVAYLKGGSEPMCPFGSCPFPSCNDFFYCGDVNGNCSYNGLDITYGVNYLKGGDSPIPCPACPPIN